MTFPLCTYTSSTHNALPLSLSDETKGDYDTRKAEVDQFNLDNAFRKRGISLVPMIWFQAFGAFKYTVQVKK